jgi:hypothetical protein
MRARQAYDEKPPTIRARAPSRVELEDEDIIASRPSRAPAVPPARRGRDPLPVLSVKLEQLGWTRTTWEAAGVCASALMRTLSARAVLVHLYDASHGEIRIVGAHGAHAQDLLGAVETVADCVFASAAVTNGKPVHVALAGLSSRLVPRRHDILKATTSLDIVPVVVDGRCIAIIEALDVAAAWKHAVVRAMTFTAEHLATAVSGL